MTLPTTGQISLGNVQSEFGGSNPISMSEYYRGGSYVDDSWPNKGVTGIPSSGAITLDNFHGKSDIPLFSVTLKWTGSVVSGQTLDVSSFMTTPYSTLFIAQGYNTGGEPYYYPPTTKLNGVDMPLITQQYTNALDDGRGWSISSKSVPSGSSAVVTWTTTYAGTGYVYEVLGFRDLYAAIHAIAATVRHDSANGTVFPYADIATPTNGVIFAIGIDTIDTTTQYEVLSADHDTAWDTNPTPNSSAYRCYGSNRGTIAVCFNLALA